MSNPATPFLSNAYRALGFADAALRFPDNESLTCKAIVRVVSALRGTSTAVRRAEDLKFLDEKKTPLENGHDLLAKTIKDVERVLWLFEGKR